MGLNSYIFFTIFNGVEQYIVTFNKYWVIKYTF